MIGFGAALGRRAPCAFADDHRPVQPFVRAIGRAEIGRTAKIWRDGFVARPIKGTMYIAEIADVYQRTIVGPDHVMGIEFDYAVSADHRPVGAAVIDPMALQPGAADRAAQAHGSISEAWSVCMDRLRGPAAIEVDPDVENMFEPQRKVDLFQTGVLSCSAPPVWRRDIY